MIKKILYSIVTLLEVILLAGSYAVDYFTRKRMGMARYVIYKNYEWDARYPMGILINIIVTVLIVLAILVLIFLIVRRNKSGKFVYIMAAVMIGAVALYVWIILTGSTQIKRSYYFVSAMCGAAAALQIIKTFIGIMVYNNEA